MDPDLVRRRIEESIDTGRALLADEHVAAVVALAELVADALRCGRKVLLCGNGGSATDATHLAAELVGRFCLDRDPLPAVSLTENAASLTAIANDFDFSEVFARQVRGLGQPGDVLLLLSTSGTSPNVLAAAEAGNALGLRTAALTGRDGGALAPLVELCLCVPADDTARVQEGSMVVGHAMCELVEQALCRPRA